ncbi:hypothetical protein SLEP1_g26328 [Rubroshorea leprosula]|uniref:Uncharacterized protein n=1 Tax=Rubroshorea leprosula TaxID=152421 RepID=A0AAV5JS48_9ROSI|nr:hypothetical protein SLEP1_g26328 [Rubroshorea leprosula]
MEFFRELSELRGNQGREKEVGVMSVEPIAMIVPPELQDLPKTFTPESSASSSAREGSGGHHSSLSEGSSLERTSSVGEGVGEGISSPLPKNVDVDVNVPVVIGWEGKTISDRLSNLRKAPQTLAVGFRFRANLHHEVVDNATSIKGYKKLEEIVRQYHIPKTILIRISTRNERACTMSQTGWIPVIYVVVCEARDTCKSSCVHIALLVPVKYHSNEVALSYTVALFEIEQGACGQNRELNDTCKHLTSDKAGLQGEVNRLQSLEMANRAASTESQADKLANKDEAARAVDHAKRAEAAKDNALNELNALRQRVVMADQDLARAEEGLRKAKTSHQRELAFFEGEEFDEEGKSLASPTDTTMRLRWELNEDGVGDAPKEEAEPSSTPPAPQPVTTATVPSPARADTSVPVDLMDD